MVKPDQPPLTPSAVHMSGCWSIPAQYASIRRVPTRILRVLLQPEDTKLVGHILRRWNFYNSRGGSRGGYDSGAMQRFEFSRWRRHSTNFDIRGATAHDVMTLGIH